MSIVKENRTYYSIIIGGKIHNVTGRKKHDEGYILLFIKDHPNKKKSNYIFEHRVMMEMYLGRYLSKHEVVHHINGIKHDNRISNLQVMESGEHTSEHNKTRVFSEESKKKISEKAIERYKNTKHCRYKEVDKNLLIQLLKEYGTKKTAEILNVSRNTVYRRIRQYNLKENEYDQSSSYCRAFSARSKF